MIALQQYNVAHRTPDERPSREHVQQLLDGHARDGWERVTAFPYEGAHAQAVDQIRQRLSHLVSTRVICKRAASSHGAPVRCRQRGVRGQTPWESAPAPVSRDQEGRMNIFYIIGVVVVVLFLLGYLGFR